MPRTFGVCIVRPDRAGRRRVGYLTGWSSPGEPASFTREYARPDVLRGTLPQARIWAELIKGDGIEPVTIWADVYGGPAVIDEQST